MKKITLLLLPLLAFTGVFEAQTVIFTQDATTIDESGTFRGVVDMNGDFLDDVVSISTTNVNIFYQNNDGSFTEANIATTAADFFPFWSMAAADYNRDGFTDLLYGDGNGVTFMRSNGTGNGFIEVSGPEDVFSQRSNFIDIDNDGNLDAFVCHDVAPNVYYINDGSGNLQFNQVNGSNFNLGDFPSGGHYGSVWIDYDNDRDVDMFIAKCGGSGDRPANVMHRRDADGNFTEVGELIGLRDEIQTWSSAWGDFDNDGDMDVFVGASSGSHKMMENNGDGTFLDITLDSGVSALAQTGIENTPIDFNNDGNLDIASNGNILYGNGDNTFTTIDLNVLSFNNGGFGDLDNDGDIDAFAVEDNGSGNIGRIYRNNGNDNNWIKINTIGTDSNINGIGARIEIVTESRNQIRDVRSGEGFRYMSSLNTHFGLGTDDAIESITIYWPSGNIDIIENPTINSTLSVVEGQTLGLEDTLVSNLIVYPNPTTEILNLSTTLNLENPIYTVFDVSGKRVLNGKLNTTTVDVSPITAGNYILRIVDGRNIMTQKFIKK
ncbi:FG-GAP-like repeat-containing protein [Jejudonia soesokkakensis]|uniref:FG-GAP-like repeat-containing protein n=1 Tax=Jejudonia soesokkakensis TaxID=1323432 RepID=A0ABW2MQV7_9FLAO